MAVSNPGPVGRLQLQAFLDKFNTLFANNEQENITEATFRILFADMARTFVNWRDLNMRNIRGGTYPLRYTDELDTIPEDMLVIGMQALARDGVTGEQAAAGERKEPVYFQLIPLSGNGLLAYVDEKPETTERIGATWVLASGSEEDRINSFPSFVEEDHPYKAGDTFKYTFPDGPTRLFEVKNDLDVQYNPLPTEEEEQPFYKPFAPFVVETHAQNTDQGTRLDRFIIQYLSQNQEQGTQRTMLGFGKAQGSKPAMLALQWQDENNNPVAKLEICYDFTSEAEYLANPDLPENVWVPVGGGGGEFSAAALAAAMHPDSQVLLENDHGQVRGRLLEGSVLLPQLEQSLQDAITQSNYVFRNGARVYLRGTDINNVLDGETVYIRQPLNVAQLVLKNATYYIVDNVPLGAELITDNGVSVTANILGGSPPEARARKAHFTGPQTNVTIEADLYLVDNTVAVTLLNGATLRHTGLLAGYGPGAVTVEIRGNSRYYHVGESRFGGGYGIQAYDTAYVEMRETVPTVYGFYQALTLWGSSVVEYYGGLQLVGNRPHAYGFNAVLFDAAVLRIKSGVFKNTNLQNFYFETGGRVEVSSAATVDGTAAPAVTAGLASGVVALREGGQVLGVFGPATPEQLPADTDGPTPGGFGGDDPRKECSTSSGHRTSNLWREGRSHLSDIVLADNATSVSAQLIQNGAAIAPARTGTPSAVATAINADIDALADASRYVVRLITTPTNAANSSTVLLTVLPA